MPHGKGKTYTMDEYMDMVDKGHIKPGTMREMRQGMPNLSMPRPKGYMFEMGVQSDIPKPKSKAPAGMATQVKGDIGEYRQMEATRASRKKLGGRSISNPLTYRKPATGIDAKFGPGDKVC